MGLSSKQVSSSGLDWKQTLLEAQDLELPKPNLMRKQQQQQTQPSESLKCPRCDSANTKFCYYNNYNKSQPRHFCRACKRHWTKGGTLRNVPVDDQKNMASSLYQALIRPPPLLLQQNMMNARDLDGKDFGIGIGNNGIFPSSTLPLTHQSQSLLFPFSTSSGSFDTNPCSVSTSLRSSNVYNYGEEFKAVEEPTINSTAIVPSTGGTNTQPWEIAATGGLGLGTSNYWNWEDFDSLVSTDLKDPWDDSDIKP
ncbi:hypothetical protein ACSQ67_004320 [Phaseolus vulgaris]